MKLYKYIKEGKISEEEWEKRIDKIAKSYFSKYQNLIKKIINNKEKQYYHYQSWDDIVSYAMDNVHINHVNDQFTTKWLKEFESSLDAILSQAKDDLI